VFVDTVAPTAAVKLYGRALVGSELHVYVSYIDLPPSGGPPADASGVAKVVVRWGDGTVATVALGSHRSFHTYSKPGRYQIAAVVTDRAGNVTRVLSYLRVTKPKSKPKSKPPKPTKPAAKPSRG
jgi:hypothetical protein